MSVADHPVLDLGQLTSHVADIRARAGAAASSVERVAACDIAVEAMRLVPDDLRQDLLAAMVEAQWSGMPQALMGPIAEEARFWAQRCDRLEAEAYLTALCDVLAGASLAESARKRLMITLWETVPGDWRRRFIAKVTRTA